eukprot:scaffold28224_cov58-Phaeocystis_antarctica.AAC.4
MQARLSATFEGAPPPSAAGGAAAATLAASLSAFSAASASRTSLVAAPRSGCCSRSLASSGLKPRSGSATRMPRTASSRASGVQGSHMRQLRRRRPHTGRTASPSLRGYSSNANRSLGLIRFRLLEPTAITSEMSQSQAKPTTRPVLTRCPLQLFTLSRIP